MENVHPWGREYPKFVSPTFWKKMSVFFGGASWRFREQTAIGSQNHPHFPASQIFRLRFGVTHMALLISPDQSLTDRWLKSESGLMYSKNKYPKWGNTSGLHFGKKKNLWITVMTVLIERHYINHWVCFNLTSKKKHRMKPSKKIELGPEPNGPRKTKLLELLQIDTQV